MVEGMKRCVLFLLLGVALSVAAQTSRPAITSLSHLAVYTSDPVKTERFYVHDTGATKRSDPEDPAGVRYYFGPVQFVEVLPLPPGYTSNSRMDHVAFNTANAEQLRAYLGEHHVSVPGAVSKLADGSLIFEVKDPEGNRVQFIEASAHPQAVASNPLSSHMIHIGFVVHNQAVEDRFYRDVLGFRPYWHGGPTDDVTAWVSIQLPDSLDWIEYMMLKPTDDVATMSQQSFGSSNHFSLGVPNMEQAANILYAGDRLGARHSGPQIGRDGKWQLNLFDPDATRVELMEFQPSIKPCCSAFTGVSPVK
jgi:catechol 2,3-dioxygenase-like lactoylglutathione lyase family enzyme